MTDPDDTPDTDTTPQPLPETDPAPRDEAEIAPEDEAQADAEYAEIYPAEEPGDQPAAAAEGTDQPDPSDAAPSSRSAGERIAKVMARAGVASRREAERMIVEGRVTVNGAVITSPALDILPADKVRIDGQPMEAPQETRLWMYYKPVGLVTSEADEKGRQTVFDALPRDMPRVMSVGRLDLNSEGLLLLTNDGALKRRLELPSTGWLRRYRVRVNGQPTELTFDPLRRGAVIDGETFQPMEIKLDSQKGANAWLTVGIREGRNREIRRAMAHVGLTVNRLIRIAYGPFRLTGMEENEVREVKRRVLRDQLGGLLGNEGEGEDAAPAARRPGGRRDERDEGRPARGPRRQDGESRGRQDRAGFDRKPPGPRAEDDRAARPYSARPGSARADRNDHKAPMRDEGRPARPPRAEGFAARPSRPPRGEDEGARPRSRDEGRVGRNPPAEGHRPRLQGGTGAERKPRAPRSGDYAPGVQDEGKGARKPRPWTGEDRAARKPGAEGGYTPRPPRVAADERGARPDRQTGARGEGGARLFARDGEGSAARKPRWGREDRAPEPRNGPAAERRGGPAGKGQGFASRAAAPSASRPFHAARGDDARTPQGADRARTPSAKPGGYRGARPAAGDRQGPGPRDRGPGKPGGPGRGTDKPRGPGRPGGSGGPRRPRKED